MRPRCSSPALSSSTRWRVSLGLADLGRRVDLVERGIRRGSGDRDLQQALERSDAGVYPD